jgi:epoxyqueuosine reductase
MVSPKQRHTQSLKELALMYGFRGVGVAKAERMDEEAKRLENWLSLDYHGEMSYMANHFDMRVDPTRLVPGAKSVICLLYNYFPGATIVEVGLEPDDEALENDTEMPDARFQIPDSPTLEESKLTPHLIRYSPEGEGGRFTPHLIRHSPEGEGGHLTISKYAYGEDYHKVVRRKLKALVAELKNEIGDFNGRVFVDSAPVMERDWAKRSGQGWIGKNTLLIHPKKGSFFFYGRNYSGCSIRI